MWIFVHKINARERFINNNVKEMGQYKVDNKPMRLHYYNIITYKTLYFIS